MSCLSGLALALLAQAPPAIEGELRDYRGVIHAHSHFSHDSEGSDARILASAAEAGLDFVLMTDHQNDPESVKRGLRGWHGTTLFAPGAEVSLDEGGSLLALDLQRHVRGQDRTAKIEDARAQDGQVWACHVEEWRSVDVEGLTGMELYNLHYDVAKDGKTLRAGARALKFLPHELPRAIAEFVDRPLLALKHWDAVTKTRRFPIVAGNDSHENVKLGKVQLDPYPLSYRVVNTHVLVRGELTVPKLREALAEGRAYLCHELFAPGQGFLCTAEHEGKTVAWLGEAVVLREGLRLRVRAPREAGIRLLRNGSEIAAVAATADWSYPLEAPGAYRVELTVEDPWDEERVRPWIYANPLYVRD